MSTRYIYPEHKFKISIDLEVDVNFIRMWDGISKKTFDCYNLEPFDRLCFGVDEYSGE